MTGACGTAATKAGTDAAGSTAGEAGGGAPPRSNVLQKLQCCL
jgi:hypothetical protein